MVFHPIHRAVEFFLAKHVHRHSHRHIFANFDIVNDANDHERFTDKMGSSTARQDFRTIQVVLSEASGLEVAIQSFAIRPGQTI